MPVLLPRWLRPSGREGDELWWPVLLPLALMLASDYKLRSRAVDQAVGGSVDVLILFEIGVYGAAALFLHLRYALPTVVRRTSGLIFTAYAFVAFAVLSVLWSPYQEYAAVRAAQLVITVILAHSMAKRASPEALRRFAHAYIALVVFSVGFGVAFPLERTPLTEDRFNWLYVHPVMAGVYLAVALLLVVAYVVRWSPAERFWPRWVYLVFMAILAAALIATGTRGAVIGAAVGAVVLLTGARGPRGRVDLMILGAAVVTVGGLVLERLIAEFILRGGTTAELFSLNSRLDLWELAFIEIKKEPIFGNGLGASRGLFLEDIGLGGGHNAFINVLVDNGAVGLVLFCGLLFTLGTVLVSLGRYRELRADASMLLGILAFFLVNSITTEYLATPANTSGIWLFILVAWTETLRRTARSAPAADPARPRSGGAAVSG